MIEIMASDVVTFWTTGQLSMRLFGVLFAVASWAVIVAAFATRCRPKLF
jgi:hypothetical protein